jgi:hypothetical protein
MFTQELEAGKGQVDTNPDFQSLGVWSLPKKPLPQVARRANV